MLHQTALMRIQLRKKDPILRGQIQAPLRDTAAAAM